MAKRSVASLYSANRKLSTTFVAHTHIHHVDGKVSVSKCKVKFDGNPAIGLLRQGARWKNRSRKTSVQQGDDDAVDAHTTPLTGSTRRKI